MLDLDNLSQQECENAYEIIKNMLAQEVIAQKPEVEAKDIRYRGGFSTPQEVTTDSVEYSRYKVDYLLTALAYPTQLEGDLSVFLGEEIIYQVENKKLLHNPFNLNAKFVPGEVEKTVVKQVVGYIDEPKLYQNISYLVEMVEKKQNEAGNLCYENNHYIFEQKQEGIAVTSKDKQEIFNQNGFTANASIEDANALAQLGKGAEIIKEQELSHKPFIRFKI